MARGVPTVFVSYRRADTSPQAGRLFDRLANRLGVRRVFMDVASITPGHDFADAIDRAISASDVVLVLIGSGWLTAADEQGRRRLDQPDDVVGLEVRSALERGLRIIPVLVDGAVMPEPGDLPAGLGPLSRRHAAQLKHASFGADADALLAAVVSGTSADRGSSWAGRTTARFTGGLTSGAQTIFRPRAGQVPALAALLAAALLASAAFPLSAASATAAAYAVGAAAAGAAVLSPRTAAVGPAVLLGTAAASVWGLVNALDLPSLAALWHQPRLELRLAGHVALLIAALLPTITRGGSGTVRIAAFGTSRQPTTVLVLVAAALGAIALLGEAWQAALAGSLAPSLAALCAGVLAIGVGVLAIGLRPRPAGAALLAGWIGGGAGLVVGVGVRILADDDPTHDPPGVLPVVGLAVALLLGAALVLPLSRTSDPRPGPTRWPVLAAGLAALLVAGAGAGVAIVRTAQGSGGVLLLDLVVSPDGRRLVALSSLDLVSVIDTADGMPVGEPIHVGPSSCCLAMSPDGARLYVSNAADVSVLDVAQAQVVGRPIAVGTEPRRLVAGPDGSRVYVAGDTGVIVIDTRVAAQVGNPVPVGGRVAGIAVSPDGRRVYAAGPQGLSTIDTTTDTVIGSPVPVEGTAGQIALVPDGRQLFVLAARPDADVVTVIDTAAQAVVGDSIPLPVGPSVDIAAGPRGDLVYVSSLYAETVSTIATSTRFARGTAARLAGPVAIATGPDYRRVYVGVVGRRAVSVIGPGSVDRDAIDIPAMHL